jgi:hypothetical protein
VGVLRLGLVQQLEGALPGVAVGVRRRGQALEM